MTPRLEIVVLALMLLLVGAPALTLLEAWWLSFVTRNINEPEPDPAPRPYYANEDRMARWRRDPVAFLNEIQLKEPS